MLAESEPGPGLGVLIRCRQAIEQVSETKTEAASLKQDPALCLVEYPLAGCTRRGAQSVPEQKAQSTLAQLIWPCPPLSCVPTFRQKRRLSFSFSAAFSASRSWRSSSRMDSKAPAISVTR